MIDCRFRPLAAWPRQMTRDRRNATFRATYRATLDLLEDELYKLAARDIIVEVAMRSDDIRMDGWPRANARVPSHPGVIVSFTSLTKGPLQFACDTFSDWVDNLRAIAKTLENLRAVERYGATKHGEQYKGYGQIESKATGDGFASAEDAARFMLAAADMPAGETPIRSIIANSDGFREQVYRKAACRLHPDAGGTTEAFQRLQTAKSLVEAR